MPRKLAFGLKHQTKAFTTPESLHLWIPKGRKDPALIYVLAHNDFSHAAAKAGYAGRDIGGFAVWGRWCWPLWQHDRIYLRADRVDLFLHEWRHVEEQRDFHGEGHED